MKKFLFIFLILFVTLFGVSASAATSYFVTTSKALDYNNVQLENGSGIIMHDSTNEYYFIYSFKDDINNNAVAVMNYSMLINNLYTCNVYGNSFEDYYLNNLDIMRKLNVELLPESMYNPEENIDPSSFKTISIVNGYWTYTLSDRAKGYVSLETSIINLPDGVGKLSFYSVVDSDVVYLLQYYNLGVVSDDERLLESYYVYESTFPDWLKKDPLSFEWISIRYGSYCEVEVNTKILTEEAEIYVGYHVLENLDLKIDKICPAFYVNFSVPIDTILNIDFKFSYQKKGFIFWKDVETITTSLSLLDEYCSASHLFGLCRNENFKKNIQKGPFVWKGRIYDYRFIITDEDLCSRFWVGFDNSVRTDELDEIFNKKISIKEDLSIVNFSYYYNEVIYKYDEIDVVIVENDSGVGGMTLDQFLNSLKVKAKNYLFVLLGVSIVVGSVIIFIKIKNKKKNKKKK